MDSLNKKISRIGEKFRQQEIVNRKLNRDIKTALKAVFCSLGPETDYLRDFYLKNGILTLRAKNKVLANEMLLYKDKIENLLNSNKDVRGLIIR